MSKASNMNISTEGFYFEDNGINFMDHLNINVNIGHWTSYVFDGWEG